MKTSPFDEFTQELLREWDKQSLLWWDEFRAEARDKGRKQGYEEGRLEAARALILLQGRRKFGRAPTRKQRGELDAVADMARLEGLAERLLDVSSWADLLNGG